MIPKEIIIHHTASIRDKTTFEDVERWHKSRFDFKSSLGFYSGYHYLITSDGTINQARKDTELGAHAIPNEGRIGICLTGNFQIEEPSEAQIYSLQGLIERLKMTYGIKEVKAHKEVNQTLCCGDNLYKWILKQRISLLQRLIQSLLKLFKK